MADNDQLLEKIGNLIDPIRQQLYEQGANIVRLVRGQKRLEQEQAQLMHGQTQTNTTLAQTNTTLSQVKTAVEALAAGQKDIRDELATKVDKADIQDLRAEVIKKVKDHENRIEALEDD